MRTIQVDKQSKQMAQGPRLLIVVDGSGCGMPRCGCSSPNFVLLSNGDTALSVPLTTEQARAIRGGGLEASFD